MCECAGQVTLVCLSAIWLLVGGTGSTTPPAPAADYWTRLNYGLAAIKVKKVCIADGYVSHIFHLPLPKEMETDIRTLNYTELPECDHICSRMKAIPAAIHKLRASIKDSITNMIAQIYQLVPDLDEKRPLRRRHTRAWFDFIGSASSYLFNTATETDIDELKEQIAVVKGLVGTAAADADRTRQGLMTFTKLTGDRLDSMHEILNEERGAIQRVVNEVRTISDSNYYEYNAIAILANELANFVQLHDEIQTFREGVADLGHGLLTPGLINPTDISAAVTNMAHSIITQRKGMVLCYKSAQEVYASRYFDYGRHGHDLFVRVRIPYTSLSHLTAYRSEVVPMAVPGRRN